MLRFVDKEVFSVTYEELNKDVVMTFFQQNGYDEIVCVLNKLGQFQGFITYASCQCTDIYQSIQSRYLKLDENIWENARTYIKRYSGDVELDEYIMIPIVDQEIKLKCFAYNDTAADRELRMLRELSELNEGFQFRDLFPEYECVKVYGFNELAFCFVKYLKKQSVNVFVYGEMWEDFFRNEEFSYLDFKCLNVFAEGYVQKTKNWLENKLRSAAVEFECIDQIYEKNINEGIIQNTIGTLKDLTDRLKACDGIVIKGTGIEALDTYNYLLKYNIDIWGFVSDNFRERRQRLFGRAILKYSDVRLKEADIIWIDPVNRGSAWGIGETDYYDYIGYHRNKNYFLIRDYVEIHSDGLDHVLKGSRCVCIGDSLLWGNLVSSLKKSFLLEETTFEYYEYERLETDTEVIKSIDKQYILWASPEETTGYCKWEERKNQVLEQLDNLGIEHYSDYFCSLRTVISIQKAAMYYSEWIPKRIVVGAIRHCCGCSFFRELLDAHPNIFIIAEYNSLNMELFWYCIRLAEYKTDEIMPLFWKIYKGDLKDKEQFNNKMKQLLKGYKVVSAQDLFVMFHIANRYMYDQVDRDITKSVIYWEPHYPDREFFEQAGIQWLSGQNVSCNTLVLVRNSIQRCGSRLKGMLKLKWFGDQISPEKAYAMVLNWVPDMVRGGIYLRFEDLKRHPVKILQSICEEWGIPWSDILMETTINGMGAQYDNGVQKISNFDLQAVYNDYEIYFSELDRLRITLLALPYQKKYGYPCVEISQFTQHDLQEIFKKKFRFRNQLNISDAKEALELDLKVQKMIHKAVQWARMLNFELEMLTNERVVCKP